MTAILFFFFVIPKVIERLKDNDFMTDMLKQLRLQAIIPEFGDDYPHGKHLFR